MLLDGAAVCERPDRLAALLDGLEALERRQARGARSYAPPLGVCAGAGAAQALDALGTALSVAEGAGAGAGAGASAALSPSPLASTAGGAWSSWRPPEAGCPMPAAKRVRVNGAGTASADGARHDDAGTAPAVAAAAVIAGGVAAAGAVVPAASACGAGAASTVRGPPPLGAAASSHYASPSPGGSDGSDPPGAALVARTTARLVLSAATYGLQADAATISEAVTSLAGAVSACDLFGAAVNKLLPLV